MSDHVHIEMWERTPLQDGGEEESDSERIEMENLLPPPQPDGGNTREEGLNQEDQHEEDHHREEGLTNGTTSASEQETRPDIQHPGVRCKGCQMNPIVGTRYECTECSYPDYNLCSACQSTGLHEHPLRSIQRPIWRPKDFKKRECNTFIEDSSRDGRCQCGRPRDEHRRRIKTAEDTEWTTKLHSSERPTDAYGYFEFEGERPSRFLRLSSDTEPYAVYDLMTRDVDDDDGWSIDGLPPSLVVSVVGGEGSAEVKPWVQEVIRQGLVKALENTDTGGGWILTEGFDGGVGRCVGEAVKGTRVCVVAISPFGIVHNKHQLVDPEGRDLLNPAQYSVENKTSGSCCLGKNHTAFLLVDDGSEGRRGGEKNFSLKFEEHIPTQHIEECSSITIPVLCMLISGESSMLERVDLSLKNGTPWLVLAGSGGVADLLSDILENQSPASAAADVVRVTELVQKHFPSEAHQLVEQVQSIYQNRELITFYHEEQKKPEDFDTVLIKSLMPASKQRASGNTFPYSKELILALRWNRVDFARSQLFNDDISDDDWVNEALKDCMTFALLNDKTQFVRLFIKKNFNFEEHLTYGFLEKLYSRMDRRTLIYKLLLEPLKERLETSDLDSLKEISLLEVSGVLKKFMDEKKPFYFTALGLEDSISGEKALEHARELLKGECSYRNDPCESLWSHLFIWAVLTNQSDWAEFFWEKAEEPVLNALSACKMLKEMSNVKEIQLDNKLSMKKLAQKFEDKAHGMLGSCYQSNESHSFEVLNRKSPVWDTNCFQMGIAVESHSFFKHDGLESTLSQGWWGDMKKDTRVLKVLLTLVCPLLLCTNLISYREPDLQGTKTARNQRTQPKDVDAPDDDDDDDKPSFVSRWRQFWRAPVTSFVGNALMYFPFLFLFAYVLLVDFKPPPPSGPSISEILLYFWVFTFFFEEIYEAFFMRDMTLRQRMKLYRKDFWNMFDRTAIFLFIIGFISRMFEGSYDFGRCVLCIDYMVFTLRLIHIFAVNKQMGPKIIIIGKMLNDVFSFILLLGVWMVAYGVANQGLKYHYDSNLYRIFRHVFYIPYLHIFGEEIDGGLLLDMADNCTFNVTEIWNGAEPCRNESRLSYWLVIILLVVFLMVTVILLINLLIAMLTKTFDKVEDESDHHWKFQHYNLIVEYQSRPVLAPPFIIISHLYLFFSFLWKKFHSKPSNGSDGEQRRARELKDCETRQMEKFLADQWDTSDSERIKEDTVDRVSRMLDQQTQTIDQKIQQMTDRVDRMEKQQQNQMKRLTEQLNETKASLNEQFTAQRTEMRALETKMEKCISDALGQILDQLNKPPST